MKPEAKTNAREASRAVAMYAREKRIPKKEAQAILTIIGWNKLVAQAKANAKRSKKS